ncbi:cytochrome C oxidase subunit IV family protein [Litoribacter ruber]|uniref:Cytochrome C oxidase subunit IV family protein n=1 Tax=Litoribacter ruber TaxID=702568 RepID=A0AAP2CHD6_9BACT|nr:MULTISPECIES: cytochrome C oxidase subunit IV family protein [Litoribacter]MBS9522645.1 cytochrome C oxidase subunit IV family protein [Litoribacter alkaliphilus]MBT0811174.1 cytochrome C oxidase subunit IV family protein [Litoribacter ruber]
MDIQDNKSTLEVAPRNAEKIKKIWKIAAILLIVTLIEYVFAFNMERGILLYSIFIGLTLVKAGYIMMEFMHLRDEAKVLVWSIMLPLIFLIWLVIALLREGTDIFLLRW